MADNQKTRTSASPPSGGAIYFLGFIGALVYYIQVAHGFWAVILAILKAFVWPAFVTYDVLKFVH